jgi:hypothetical protein
MMASPPTWPLGAGAAGSKGEPYGLGPRSVADPNGLATVADPNGLATVADLARLKELVR